jgi:tRNA pseudouridine32 synthase/23S rRNA pseudouridine746 synthase
MSQELQTWLFHQYQLLNARGEVKDLIDIWQQYYSRPKLRQKYPLPPGGTGDCCAPKLLQYAYQHALRPICMAEFWWGKTTKEELRQHLNYYPACRGKCKPILTWMLQGLDVDPNPETLGFEHMEIPTIYEDDDIVVVNKPSGILSVPGRVEDYSVETVMHQRYPGSIVAHRLDMGTSGLLLVAKHPDAYHPLQQQFIRHEIKKKYIALLEHAGQGTGIISLPLRPDPMNRPRQVVDMEHGKRAVTRYEFIDDHLVALWPETGRTHQLRIHCAHPDGLNNPIVGDELYGSKGQRLCLHAAEIWFRHPISGEEMHFETTPDFL